MLKFLQRLIEKIVPRQYNATDIPALTGLPLRIQEVLEKYNPLLLQELEMVVKPAAERWIAEHKKHEAMQAEYQPQILQHTAEQASLSAILTVAHSPASPNHKIPKHLRPETVKANKWVEWMVNIALAFMLALGITHAMEIKFKDPKPGQEKYLVLALIVAIGITVATKWGISFWVVRTRSNETITTFPDPVAFWERLRDGDVLSYMTIAIPLGETLFAAPGLIENMSFGMEDNIFALLGMYMVAGLTATINVFLAWGQGWEKLRLRQEQTALRETWLAKEAAYELALQTRDADPVYQQYSQRLEEVTALCTYLERDLELQGAIAQAQFHRAKKVYEDWKRLLDRWCKRHHRLIKGG